MLRQIREHCTGYETEGRACRANTAKVHESHLQATRKAAFFAGPAQLTARQTDDINIGGGASRGAG